MLTFTVAICFAGVAIAATSAEVADPSYGGIFTTSAPKPYVQTDEYVQIENKEDEFDWKLSKEIFKDNRNKNVVISPISVKILLTLLAEAAGQDVNSKTRKELEAVLPKGKNLYVSKEYFAEILNSLNTVSDDFKVNFATKIYADKDVSVNQRYASIVKHNYLADMENLDFIDSRNSAKNINAWVSEATNGRIHDLVSEDAVSNSVLLMLNAVFFEGTWRYGFNKSYTQDFTTSQGSRSKKSFMEHTGNFYYFFSKELNAKIVRLPYKGYRFSMFIILPVEINGLDRVVEKLNSDLLRNEVWHMDESEIRVVIPKFKFDASVNLNDVVKKLGIRDIFDNNATLPLLARGGSSEGKLKVSNIIQKAGINVDEKGTTAYAATEIELVNKFGGEPEKFIADHPFVFYIEDDTTGAKLFSGIVNNPDY